MFNGAVDVFVGAIRIAVRSLTGTIAADGTVSGTVAFFGGNVAPFTGSLTGSILTRFVSGRDSTGDTCMFAGTFSVSR